MSASSRSAARQPPTMSAVAEHPAARELEEAALRAWPALEQHIHDGWCLRFARGYTKRANSVTPLGTSALPLDQHVSCCEAEYRRRGLTPIFRIAQPWAPAELDRHLEKRGYARVDRTHVIAASLDSLGLPGGGLAVEQAESASAWVRIYSQLGGRKGAEEDHVRLLNAIASPRFFAQMREDDAPVACGIGVLDGSYLGLFDLLVGAQHRGRGIGTGLIAQLGQWARAHQGRWAYLQVTHSNTAARKLYEGLGFADVYTYWYRVSPTLSASSLPHGGT